MNESIAQHMARHREELPDWIRDFRPTRSPELPRMLSGRTVFYPGGATDGHPIGLFAASHACHCFVYADYGVTAERFRSYCQRFRGYAVVDVQDMSVPFTRRLQRVVPRDDQRCPAQNQQLLHATLALLERRPDAAHDGADRFAVLYLGIDAFVAFDAICTINPIRPPFGILLQDHGFGGNWDRFGARGELEVSAVRHGVLPDWIVCAGNTRCWTGYRLVPGVEASVGGQHRNMRSLWRRQGAD
jgi:hypothetical protein